MLSHMLKAKLHMATVTQAELWYDGSCAIDADLVALAGMREFARQLSSADDQCRGPATPPRDDAIRAGARCREFEPQQMRRRFD